jgi:hypothetical protein
MPLPSAFCPLPTAPHPATRSDCKAGYSRTPEENVSPILENPSQGFLSRISIMGRGSTPDRRAHPQ